MALEFKIEGLDEYIAALTRAPEIVNEEIRVQMKTEMEAVSRLSRNNHGSLRTGAWIETDVGQGYTTRSGNLEKSVDYEVSEDGLTAKIWVSKTKSATPYSWRIHEGFVGKYDVLGRYFTGPAPTPFLYNAAKNYQPELTRNIELAIMRGFMKAGL